MYGLLRNGINEWRSCPTHRPPIRPLQSARAAEHLIQIYREARYHVAR